jgi:cytochrome c-type biogenesis protein CcmH
MLMLCGGWAAFVQASVDVHQFDSPAQAAQYQAMIDELRCPKCQNQNLAGSDAPIAQDLKQKTYQMVKDGQTDQQIRDYMIARYGDFISYRPPVRPSTWVLWFLPPVLLVLVLGGWFWQVRQRTKQRQHLPLSASEQARLAHVLATSSEDTTRQPVTPRVGDSHDV